MAEPISLRELIKIDGIVGAVRWKDAVVGKAGAAAPVLQEYVGLESEERARHLMLAAEAYGLSIRGIAQLNYEFREDFRQNISPLDAFYIHGYKYSMFAAWNGVGALIDNAVNVDIEALSRTMVMVVNR